MLEGFELGNDAIDNSFRDTLSRYPGQRHPAVFLRSYEGSKALCLRCVPALSRHTVAVTTTLDIVINVFLDDIADVEGEIDLIHEAREHMMADAPLRSARLAFLGGLWSVYRGAIESAPSHDALRPPILSAWHDFFSALEYSVEVNRGVRRHTYPDALRYLGPNMLHALKHLTDAAFTPGWPGEDTPELLRFARAAEQVTRIGNWLKSWEQELRQASDPHRKMTRDISSGVIALAIDQDILSQEQALREPAALLVPMVRETRVAALGDMAVPDFLMNRALEVIDWIASEGSFSRFVDLPSYARALRAVLEAQLVSHRVETR